MKKKWLCAMVFFVGCGSTTTPLSPQEFCEGIQRTHCARLYQCATTPALQAALQNMFADEQDCFVQGMNAQTHTCNQWTEDRVCGNFGSAWNDAAGRTCLNALDTQVCTKALTGVLPGSCTPAEYCL